MCVYKVWMWERVLEWFCIALRAAQWFCIALRAAQWITSHLSNYVFLYVYVFICDVATKCPVWFHWERLLRNWKIWNLNRCRVVYTQHDYLGRSECIIIVPSSCDCPKWLVCSAWICRHLIREDLLTIVKRHKLQWYGHVSRSSRLATTILQGTVKRGRRQGRQRKKWEDNIREWIGLEIAKSQRAVENREKWR